MEKYYSEEMREEMIELSDAHILWECELKTDKDLHRFYNLCDEKKAEFEKIYNTEVLRLGRSARYVCVHNTPENRKRAYNMKRTVRRMQETIMETFGGKKNVRVL